MSIKEIFFSIATCGPLGAMHFGGLLASLLALPIIFLGYMLYWFSPALYYVFLGIALLLAAVAIYITLTMPSEQDSSVIVLDRVIGLGLVYCSFGLTIKLYAVGFVLFHITNFILPWVLAKFWDIYLNQLPSVIGIVAGDILAGISIHILLKLIMWLAH